MLDVCLIAMLRRLTHSGVDKFWSCWWSAKLEGAALRLLDSQSERVESLAASWRCRLGTP